MRLPKNEMRHPRALLLCLGFIVLSALSGFLYYRTQAIDIDVQDHVLPVLRELKQLDAEWNANVLKSRIGINSNYDPVTTLLQHLHALRARLRQGVDMAQGNALETASHQLEVAFASKEDLIEQFKSQNALLQNSLFYFPTAVEDLHAMLHQEHGTGSKQVRPLAALSAEVDQLLTDILLFNLNPAAELEEKILSTVARIEERRGTYPDTLRESLDLLTRHARIIVRQRLAEDALTTRIVSLPTAKRIDDVRSAFDVQFKSMLEEKQRYRTYLFAYSGFLLILLSYAAWRLMHSYQVIARVNKHLQVANETLEQRVAERTAELEHRSAQLAELATYDTLTGLINRRHLMAELTQALQRAERRGWVVALMFIDLDGFKEINDTYGHAAGDRVLQEVAARIKRHVRKEDAMGRLGGDEFVIVLNEIHIPDGAIRIAEAVLHELHALTELDGRVIRISASIGISSTKGGAKSPELLLSEADHAMYRAKECGKSCYRFSDATCHA